MKHVAVMGYGTVGSGVYEVLTKNKDVVSKNVGEELNVKWRESRINIIAVLGFNIHISHMVFINNTQS